MTAEMDSTLKNNLISLLNRIEIPFLTLSIEILHGWKKSENIFELIASATSMSRDRRK